MVGIETVQHEVMSKVVAGRTLLCLIDGDSYVMTGAPTGNHRLYRDCTSDARLKAHWDGYGAMQEVEPPKVTPVRCPAPKKQAVTKVPETREYTVTLRYQYPAWDEHDGIAFEGIMAASKREAVTKARQKADDAWLLGGGRGLCWFTAVEVE